MPVNCHIVGGGASNLALEWLRKLLVDRTDLAGSYKNPVLGQLVNLSVPWFSHL